jgi:hypothetical protein
MERTVSIFIPCFGRARLHADSIALGFQFARVGNDEGAKKLLDMLDLDPEIGDYVDCLASIGSFQIRTVWYTS